MTTSQELLERLVDDELTPSERTRVLHHLASETDGWQRLATTFLESQTIARACRPFAAGTAPGSPLTLAPPPPMRRSTLREPGAAVTAVALAFLLGLWTGSGPDQPPTEPAPVMNQVAGTIPPEPTATPREQAVILGDPRSGYTTVTVPVYDSVEAVPDKWNEVPTTVKLLQQALSGPGRRLESREDWIPVTLANGQPGMMPIREWSIRPTSLAEYP